MYGGLCCLGFLTGLRHLATSVQLRFVANLFRKDPKFAEAFAKEEDAACLLGTVDTAKCRLRLAGC